MEKTHAKLTARAKNQKERDARLASLSPRLRQRYADWVRAHRPGRAADRRRAKEWRRQDADARASIEALLDRPPPPPSAEAQALAERIAALEAQLAVIITEQADADEIPATPDDEADDANRGAGANFNTGVFE